LSERIFIGVAWPYANGPLHLGHITGAYLPADIFARYHRLKGNKVLMVSGSDQHGAPITIRAEQESTTPQEMIYLLLPALPITLKLLMTYFSLCSIRAIFTKTRCCKLTALNASVSFLTGMWKVPALTVASLRRGAMNVMHVASP